jgi:cellulose biosynthesis protein BcsQ
MRTLAIYNIKGGVGKTSTTVNLAFIAARESARTLLWDLDPQGASSYYLGVKPAVRGGGDAVLKAGDKLASLVKKTEYDHLHVLPADLSYRNFDLLFENARQPTQQLAQMTAPLAASYDYLLLDCPPGISLLSENIFHAADVLLVPMIPTTLSLRTLHQLYAFLRSKKLTQVRVFPFLTMVDRRKALHQEVMEVLPQEEPDLLETYIPYASDVERMGVNQAPLATYAPRSPSARAYESLWNEIQLLF